MPFILFLFAVGAIALFVAVFRKQWTRPAGSTEQSRSAPTGSSGDTDDIDPRLRRQLAVEDRNSLRLLSRHHVSLADELQAGEIVRLVVAERASRPSVVVVTSHRLLVANKQYGVQSISPERIRGTRLTSDLHGQGMTLVDGPGLVLMFADVATANLLAVTIDNVLIAPPSPAASDRDIPALLPDYYRRILFATGKPDSPQNTVAIMELLTQMLWFNASVWFDETGDTAAAQEFDARFARGGADPNRTIHLVDDMIDYLWAWRVSTHQGLRDFVHDSEEILTAPTSQLWRHGADLPMGLWSEED